MHRLRAMGMSAMLVMDMVRIMMPGVPLCRDVVADDSRAFGRMVVMMMSVMFVMAMILAMVEGRCARRRKLRFGSAER